MNAIFTLFSFPYCAGTSGYNRYDHYPASGTCFLQSEQDVPFLQSELFLHPAAALGFLQSARSVHPLPACYRSAGSSRNQYFSESVPGRQISDPSYPSHLFLFPALYYDVRVKTINNFVLYFYSTLKNSYFVV